MPIFDYGYSGYPGGTSQGYPESRGAMGYPERSGMSGSGMGMSGYSERSASMGSMGGGYSERSTIGYISGPSPYARDIRERSRSPIANNPPEMKCFKCTKLGHMAKDCTAELLCYSCNGTGHISRDCKDATNGPKCYNCQNIGHMAKDCPSLIAQGMVAQGLIGPQGVNTSSAAINGYMGAVSRGAAGGHGGMGMGGMARAAYSGVIPRAGRSGVNCHQCGGFGHMARDCPTEKKCYKCQGLGHIARLCPTNVDGGGGGRSMNCFKCNQEGHFARDCKADSATPPTTTTTEPPTE